MEEHRIGRICFGYKEKERIPFGVNVEVDGDLCPHRGDERVFENLDSCVCMYFVSGDPDGVKGCDKAFTCPFLKASVYKTDCGNVIIDCK